MSDEGVSLDCFKLWSITALRSYLHLRRKSTEGSPEELAARCVVGKFFQITYTDIHKNIYHR